MTEDKPETPRDRLFEMHREMSARALKLMRSKNADYAVDDGDPLSNFRRHGLLGVLVRADDKLARLNTFVKRGTFSVMDEAVEDTLIDLLNYSVIFAFYISEEKRKTGEAVEKA